MLPDISFLFMRVHRISLVLAGCVLCLMSASEPLAAEDESLFHTYLSQYKETLCKVQEAAARKNLSDISKAIERYVKSNNGQYPGKEDDFAAMYPASLTEKFHQNTVKGYTYEFQLDGQGYSIKAVPSACGVTGRKVFQVQSGGKISEQACDKAVPSVSVEKEPGANGTVQAPEEPAAPLPDLRSYTSSAHHYDISVPEGWTIVSRDHFQHVDPSLMNSSAEILILHQQGKAWGMIIPEKVSVPFNLNMAKERLLDNLRAQSLEVLRDEVSFDYGDGGIDVEWRVVQGDARHNYMILFVVFEDTGLQMMAWTLESDAEQMLAQLKDIMRAVAVKKP